MKRLSILIADAAPELCWQIRRWLPTHHTTCVHSTKEAMNASRLLRFELVVGDTHMPNSSGVHLFEVVKQRQPWARLLALTRPDILGTTHQAFRRPMQLGAHAVAMKPIHERQFMLALRACWNDAVIADHVHSLSTVSLANGTNEKTFR